MPAWQATMPKHSFDTSEGLCRKLAEAGDRAAVVEMFVDEKHTLSPLLCNLCPVQGECVLSNLEWAHTQAGMPPNARNRYRRKALATNVADPVKHARDHAQGANLRAVQSRIGRANTTQLRVLQQAAADMAAEVLPEES